MFDVGKYREMDLSSYDILVVDDTPVNVILIQKMLSRFTFKIDTAVNGTQSLDKIKASIEAGKRYSLVLLDIKMPDISGYDVLSELKTMPGAEGMPVVVLSGLAGSDSIAEAMNLGAVDFIQKPIIMDNLYETIFKYLNLL